MQSRSYECCRSPAREKERETRSGRKHFFRLLLLLHQQGTLSFGQLGLPKCKNCIIISILGQMYGIAGLLSDSAKQKKQFLTCHPCYRRLWGLRYLVSSRSRVGSCCCKQKRDANNETTRVSSLFLFSSLSLSLYLFLSPCFFSVSFGVGGLVQNQFGCVKQTRNCCNIDAFRKCISLSVCCT